MWTRYNRDANQFRRVGRQFVRSSRALGGLGPTSQVLDVGCGVGRFAVALTEVLTDGTYDGIDVATDSIAWCRENVSASHPNFRFHLVEARNERYAPEHGAAASEVPFPFADESFDFVFSNSLFTHLLTEDAVHYLSEMARVMRRGARMLSTIFVIDEKARAAIGEGQAKQGRTLSHRIGDAYIERPEKPEAVVAYDESFVVGHLDGLPLDYEILHGSWSGGHPDHGHFGAKDILLASKR